MQYDKDAAVANPLFGSSCNKPSERKYRFIQRIIAIVEHGFYKEYLVSITKKE
jgi:hypothetical protein